MEPDRPRLRVLLLCDRYPFPLTNGQNLRIYHYVCELAGRHDFHLMCYADGPPPEEIWPLFRSIRTFPRPQPVVGTGTLRILEALNVDRMVAASEPMRQALADPATVAGIDVLWISGWDTIVNLPLPMTTPVLADAVDDGVLEYLREIRAARSPVQFIRAAKWAWMNLRFERRFFGRATRCLFVSEVDARCFRTIAPRTPVSVVPNGVDTAFFRPSGGPVEPATLIFEGNIGFLPNTDAVLFFASEVLPLVRRAVPEVRLRIVGKDPPAAVQALACPAIEVTGFVPDVRPYVHPGTVFVCPLRKGAGIKNKILQAWAMGKAVVATPASVGGLAIDEGVNILVRDRPQAMAAAIVELLRCETLRTTLEREARRHAVEHASWDRASRAMEDVLMLTARSGGEGA